MGSRKVKESRRFFRFTVLGSGLLLKLVGFGRGFGLLPPLPNPSPARGEGLKIGACSFFHRGRGAKDWRLLWPGARSDNASWHPLTIGQTGFLPGSQAPVFYRQTGHSHPASHLTLGCRSRFWR